MKPLKLIIGTLFLPTAISLAIVDTNENGLSDLWEQSHNNGDIFPETYDPQADPDQDGWTNAQEAAAGTDPADPNPPDGIIAPDLLHTPAVMGTDGNGQPIIITPEVLTVSWPTLIGKQYTLLFSPDLTAPSWLQVPQSTFIGDGNIHEFNFDLTSGNRCFWRVSITDCDTDEDGLSNSEESYIGTNPSKLDTDYDGMPDGWEFKNGLNPRDDGTTDTVNGADGDLDNDGIKNKSDSTPAVPDELIAVIESERIEVFEDQAGFHKSTSIGTEKISIDQLFIRYPQPIGIVMPIASAFFDTASNFGEMTKATIWIEATELVNYSRKVNIFNILDEDYPSILGAEPNVAVRDSIDFEIHPMSMQSDAVEIDPGITDLTDDTPSQSCAAYVSASDLLTDLNNDGAITAEDALLRDGAFEANASSTSKEKGTEYLFHNDQFSNGLWDKEDKDSGKPANMNEDDDVQEIKIPVSIPEGQAWLDHPAISAMSFYKSRKCNPTEKINLSPSSRFDITSENKLPERVYVRLDGSFDYSAQNPQIEGDLVLNLRVGANGPEVTSGKIKLTIVKAIGATSYFHAAREYMFENNSKLCVRKETIGNLANPSYKRIVSMIHEKTEMKAVDSFHRNPKLFGIDAVTAGFPSYDVAVNGNFCYSSDPTWWSSTRPQKNTMTDKCHGRLITSGVAQASSSTGGSSIYESSAADFIGWNSATGIHIQTGVIPVSPMTYTEALGGFGSNLMGEGGWHPWFGIANAGDKKVFFVATPFTVAGSGAGGRVELRQKLASSGCPALPGGQPGEIQCVYGDGGSSLGLAYKISNGTFATKLKGSKHAASASILPQQGDYFINTYLLFKSTNPR